MMQLPPAARRRAAARSPLRDTLEGFRFVARTAPVRALLLLLGVVSFAGMPYSVLMPVFAESILHGGAQGTRHADGGVRPGRARRRARRWRRARRARPRARGSASRRAAFGVALVLFSLSRSFWLSARAAGAGRRGR